MAYVPGNLFPLKQSYDGTHGAWMYFSADAIAAVNTTGYFSDAVAKGVKTDDLIFVLDTTNHLWDICMFASAANGDITDGLRVTATNSD